MTGYPRIASLAFLALVAGFIAIPLIVVAAASLNGAMRMDFPPVHPSLHWYGSFFRDRGWVASFRTSILIATSASLLSVCAALPVCHAIWKYRSRTAIVMNATGLVSIFVPTVILALVFMTFWSVIGYSGHLAGVIISEAAVSTALPLIQINLGFLSVRAEHVEAAQTMGARPGDINRTVLLPILLPYLFSAFVFVFISCLNEYIIAYMVAGFSVETLPIRVFRSLRMGFQPTMCVGAVLYVLAGTAAFGLVGLVADLPKLLGGRSS
jgi:putative spermidine/putrescine transport system permease protein